MKRIWALGLNTFKEAVRDRVLFGVLGGALLVIGMTLVMAQLSLHEEERVISDVGLATISSFSVIMTIFLGSSLLYKEIDRKTLYVILPKPIHRHEFLLGKYLGIVLSAFVFIAVMGGFHLWITIVQYVARPLEISLTYKPPFGVWVPFATLSGFVAAYLVSLWKRKEKTLMAIPFASAWLVCQIMMSQAVGHPVSASLYALILILSEVVLLSAVATMFSAFSTPFLTGLFTAGVWFIGRGVPELLVIKTRLFPVPMKMMLRQLAKVVPNFNLFSPGRYVLEGDPFVGSPTQFVVMSVAYAMVYAVVLLFMAQLIFKKRDFV